MRRQNEDGSSDGDSSPRALPLVVPLSMVGGGAHAGIIGTQTRSRPIYFGSQGGSEGSSSSSVTAHQGGVGQTAVAQAVAVAVAAAVAVAVAWRWGGCWRNRDSNAQSSDLPRLMRRQSEDGSPWWQRWMDGDAVPVRAVAVQARTVFVGIEHAPVDARVPLPAGVPRRLRRRHRIASATAAASAAPAVVVAVVVVPGAAAAAAAAAVVVVAPLLAGAAAAVASLLAGAALA